MTVTEGLSVEELDAMPDDGNWVVDPGLDGEPSITAWDLVDSRYEQVGRAVGGQTFTADVPYVVELVPADLTR